MLKTDILERIFSIKGKCALITGSSSGIGRALAVGFAEAGARVAVHGTRQEKIDETLRVIEDKGCRADGFLADLTVNGAPNDLASRVCDEMGGIDILVNNAGMNRRNPINEVTEEDYDLITTVNLRSVFFLCKAVYPIMRSRGGGKIINTGSLTTVQGLAGIPVYGITKSALGQFTKTAAVEWAKDNIQVNCIAPGLIQTPLTEAGLLNTPYTKKWLLDRIPCNRVGQPEDLVGLGLLLASEGSSYITGQTILIDGGFTAGGDWRPPQE